MILRIAAMPASVVLLAGCAGQAAFGRTEDTKSAWPAFNGFTKTTIEISVIDRRPYVLSGSKSTNFVGLSRGGFGNPFDITTSSGNSLAEDLDSAVMEGLQNSGISAVVADKSDAEKQKASAPDRRLLLITLLEWKSDTYTTTSFSYDLSGAVYDSRGILLLNQSVSGTKNASSGVDGGRQALTDLLGIKRLHQALADQK